MGFELYDVWNIVTNKQTLWSAAATSLLVSLALSFSFSFFCSCFLFHSVSLLPSLSHCVSLIFNLTVTLTQLCCFSAPSLSLSLSLVQSALSFFLSPLLFCFLEACSRIDGQLSPHLYCVSPSTGLLLPPCLVLSPTGRGQKGAATGPHPPVLSECPHLIQQCALALAACSMCGAIGTVHSQAMPEQINYKKN